MVSEVDVALVDQLLYGVDVVGISIEVTNK